MKGSHGYRRKTRNLHVDARRKGKTQIRKLLADFADGDIVSIAIDARSQAIPNPRFQGKTGRVVGRQGRSFFVQVTDGKATKKLLVAPEHLIKGGN